MVGMKGLNSLLWEKYQQAKKERTGGILDLCALLLEIYGIARKKLVGGEGLEPPTLWV